MWAYIHQLLQCLETDSMFFNFVNLWHQDGPLKKNLLVSENVYLLHSTDKICLWIGKHAKMEAKKHAMHTAVEYIKKVGIEKGKQY